MARLFRSFTVLVICTASLQLTGCGKREEPPSEPTAAPAPGSGAQAPALAQGVTAPEVPAPTDSAQMAARNAEAFKAMNQGKDIQPVAPGTLKEFLPATLAGMERGETDAKQMGMMGINVASAQADYQASGGSGMLELMIMDLGNASGPMRMGITGWTMAQVDRQTDTGYEKTVTYQGYKGMEEYDRQDQHGKFRVLVADRFVVEVTGDDTTMETIKQAMGQVDLKKLAQAAK